MRCSNLLSTRPTLRSLIALCLAAAFAMPAVAAFVDPPPNAKDALKQGAKLMRRGDYMGAESVLRRASEANPDSNELKTELAYSLVKQRRVRDAYDLLLPIVKADPKDSHAFAVLGSTYLAAGHFDDARVLLRNAILLNRKEHLAWASYGMVDFYENHVQDALGSLREAVYRQPDEPDYLFSLAQVSSRAELYNDAAEGFRRFLEVSNKLDKDRRDRIKGLIDFLDYLGKGPKLYNVDGPDKASVPFELVGDRPVIKVRVNDRKEELRFVLDTGSGISVMSTAAAKRLGISAIARGGSGRGIGGDGKFDIVYGVLNKVNIGDVQVTNVPIYLRPFHQSTIEADGYIGLSLISKFLTTIDYGDHSFSLTKRDSDRQEFSTIGPELSLPLRLTTSGFLSGEVSLQGVDTPLNFIVDTGASISVISNEIANSDGLKPFIHDGKYQVIGSAGVANDVQTFKLPRVTFGKNTRKDILAVALDLGIINEASGFEQAGILGGNFLKNYRLTFDFRNARVIFQPLVPDKE